MQELHLNIAKKDTHPKDEVDDGIIRQFATGATRDSGRDKLDFEGFLSPLVMERYAEYMHMHLKKADGTLRESDNWQKGIPLRVYMQSMWRHFFAVWKGHREHQDVRDDLCALMFNVMGMLHELLKIGTGSTQTRSCAHDRPLGDGRGRHLRVV